MSQPLVGTVDGHVVDAETNLPLRFVEIRLVPKPTEADLQQVTPQVIKEGMSSTFPKVHVTVVSGTSGIDGSFRLERVPVGDYLVGAIKSGYLVPAPGITTNFKITPEQLKSLVASIPVVHVADGQIATVNLSAHRGAVIAGRVQFADASPAIGIPVSYALSTTSELLPDPQLRWRPSPFQEALSHFDVLGDQARDSAVTDDEGRYRFAGVAPGKYLVTASLFLDHDPARVSLSGGGELNEELHSVYPELVPVYSPGVFRVSEATVIETRGSERILDADIQLDPSGLHVIRGRVFAAGDSHPLNSYLVQLSSKGSKDPVRFVEANAGSFQIDDVPSGKYTLEIMANNVCQMPCLQGDAKQSYKSVKLPILVGSSDLDLSDILLVALSPESVIPTPSSKMN